MNEKKKRMEEGSAAKAAAQFLAQPGTDLIADIRARIAYLIRAELVCCDIYEKITAPLATLKEKDPYSLYREKRAESEVLERLAKKDGSYHAICYYGEWAAQLAETGDLPTGEIWYGPWGMVAGRPDEPSESDRPKRDQEPS